MNKVLLLLLVTLVQSQSDGILLPTSKNLEKSDDNLEDFQLEDWDNSDSIYSLDADKDYAEKYQVPSKRLATDLLTRRSSLDKNFMRFGRRFGEPHKFLHVESSPFSENRPNFDRFGRGLKDNFIRFGRGAQDNFIRFGRGAQDNFIRFGRGAQDNFIRFGRGAQDNFIRFGRGSKDSFIRFGRLSPDFFRSGKSERVNFIRFGKADKNFMRFGREKTAGSEEKSENLDNQNYLSRLKETMNEGDGGSFERFIKAFGPPDNFIRFGKSGNQKEKRNSTNFLRFGKKDPTEEDEPTEDSDAESTTTQDSSYPAIMRVKRKATNEDNPTKPNGDKLPEKKAKSGSDISTDKPEHPTGKGFEKRSTGYFEEMPEGIPRRSSPFYGTNSWQGFDNLGQMRWSQPYFPTFSNFPNNPYLPFANIQSKRDQEGGGGRSGSNFIRFG